MSQTNNRRSSHRRLVWLIPLSLIGLGLVLAFLIHDKNIALFHAKGLIAQEQLRLMIFTGFVLLAAAVPTLFLLYFTAWKYRESNAKATYDPQPLKSKSVLATMWLVPAAFAVLLTIFMWPATHKLEPRDAIAADKKPMTIQVISMRWKWVFLYPEQQIATVNFVQMPVDTPVVFELTGDEAPMSSFWIPNLGGQLYSMTSHVNKLNLMAEEPGDYPGVSAEINGPGFSGMKFTARASSDQDFNKWVKEVRQSENVLDTKTYGQLLKPSENIPVNYYATYDSNLYDKVLMKYQGSHKVHTTEYKGGH